MTVLRCKLFERFPEESPMTSSDTSIDRCDRIAGLILGTAVGDALGVPREGLSPKRAKRVFGVGPLEHRLLFGHGMVSDDTEHTCLVGQALLESAADAEQFSKSLAWRLRWWLAGLPAGVGLGTARALLKLWCGWPPGRSGVNSAGNGPAMRAALLGACLANDPERLASFIRASTRLTHVDPRAETGSLLVALAAAQAANSTATIAPETFLDRVRGVIRAGDDELAEILVWLEEDLNRGKSPAEFAASLGLEFGVTGYIYHTVPVALYCWLGSGGCFRQAVEDAISLGGDTDTLGAIVGGLCGATHGMQKIPREWLVRLLEWPRSERWMLELASRLAQRFPDSGDGAAAIPVPLFWPGQLLRNILFLNVVLIHGFRRLLPPY
jgi:ADP-ribosylglycohydrolase